MRYGGNTTCLEVEARAAQSSSSTQAQASVNLGRALADESLHHLDLLLTHLHLDHIEGLGFFALLFDPESTIKIHGPRPTNGTLKEKIAAYLSPPYFPVPFERIDARLSFEEIENDSWDINGLRISSAPVCHPGRRSPPQVEEHGAASPSSGQRARLEPNPASKSPGAPMSCSMTLSTPTRSTRPASAGATPRLGDFAAYLRAARPGAP